MDIKLLLQEIFFKTQLTFLDFLIIGLGIFIMLFQILVRITTISNRFYKKAIKDPLFITKTEVKLTYIANLIEMLPLLGLLGTVWGLRNALALISSIESPAIKDIAFEIAPALSTTLFGLIFAVLNLFLYNFLHAYFTELITWCRNNMPVQQPVGPLQEKSPQSQQIGNALQERKETIPSGQSKEAQAGIVKHEKKGDTESQKK